MSIYDAEVVEWDDENEAHLADHGISTWQASDVIQDSRVAVPNKKPNDHRWLLIGKDRGGLTITLVVEYDSIRRSIRPITGWASTTAEKVKYL